MLAASSAFVGTNGTMFKVNGQQLRLSGANNYYLAFAPDSMVEPVFDLAAQLGLNVLRTWAFLDSEDLTSGWTTPANGTAPVCFHYWDSVAAKPAFNDGPNGLERLDRTIALAEQYQIRLILPLVNYWKDFGGVPQYLKWFGLTSLQNFYRNTDVKQAYRDYVEHIVLRENTRTGRRYREEPAILAWELANEPRCVDDEGHPIPDGVDTLTAWVDEMSAYLKSIDPNHLVSVGDEGYFKRKLAFGNNLYNGSFGVDTERLLALPTIDFGTCHLYPQFAAEKDPVAFGTNWIREHIEAGKKANKPMIIEEYGWKAIDSDPNTSRNAAFQVWLDQVIDNGGAGALVWMIASSMPDGKLYPDYDGYTIYAAEDVPAIVAYSQSVASDA